MIRWIVLFCIAYWVVRTLRKSMTQPSGRTHAQRNRPTAKNPYEILLVPQNADAQTVKTAYRKALSQNHPDKVAHLSQEIQATARQKMDEIQWAYDQLR